MLIPMKSFAAVPIFWGNMDVRLPFFIKMGKNEEENEQENEQEKEIGKVVGNYLL